MLGFIFCSKLDREIGALIRSMKFLSPRVALFLSINVPDGHALNTVVMSGLVLLTVTC